MYALPPFIPEVSPYNNPTKLKKIKCEAANRHSQIGELYRAVKNILQAIKIEIKSFPRRQPWQLVFLRAQNQCQGSQTKLNAKLMW